MIAWLASAALGGSLADQVALHLRIDGQGADTRTLGSGYQPLCDAGDGLACKWRAWDAWGRVKRSDLARIADPSCQGGRAEACLLVAWGLGLSDAAAYDLLRDACEADVPRACTELGVVLTEDRLVDPEPDRAKALHARACAAGVAAGCLRAGDDAAARDLGAPSLLPPAQACDAGVVRGCVARLDEVAGPERLAVLERLCHLDGAHCAALAGAREPVAAGAALPSGVPSRAAFAGTGLLLGWDAETFQDHALVDLSTVDRIEIRNVGARHERLVVIGPGDREVVLPGEKDCDEVVRLARGFRQAGVLPRVVDEVGAPAMSTCIDLLGPGVGPDYQGGRLAVDPVNPADVGPATELKAMLVDHVGGLFACGDAASSGRTLDAQRVAVQHKRKDRLHKPTVLKTSRSPDFDRCVLDWLVRAPVAPATVPARHEIEVLLIW